MLNSAIDMPGGDHSNVRRFENTGCGCARLSDTHRCQDGLAAGITMASYDDPSDALAPLKQLLSDLPGTNALAAAGHRMVAHRYSGQSQRNRIMDFVQ